MEKGTTIKLIKQLDVTDLAGEKVMIDFETGKYFLLKGSANDIWDILVNASNGILVEDIIQKLMDDYEVDYEVCQASVMDFLQHLDSLDFIACQ